MSHIDSVCVLSPSFVLLLAANVAAAPATERVSVRTLSGLEANGWSAAPSLTPDGRYVAFCSAASNLVYSPPDTNAVSDVFVHDHATGETVRLSVRSDGGEVFAGSLTPVISADGRFVAFSSDASDLVVGDTNGVRDVFVHDRLSGETARVSLDGSGNELATPSAMDPLSGSMAPSISASGRWVAFSNLLWRGWYYSVDLYVHDRESGATTLASRDTLGQPCGNSGRASLSGDGRFIAFEGDCSSGNGLYFHDRESGVTSPVAIGAGNSATEPALDAGGRYLAFASVSSALVSGDTNGVSDVFVYDRLAGSFERVSVGGTGQEGDGPSGGGVAISPDGRFVAFVSAATNLVAGDTNGIADVFVHDRATGETRRANVDSAGNEADGASGAPAISTEGQFVALESSATNLVASDQNGASDVFLHGPLVSRCYAGTVNRRSGPIADVLLVNGSAGGTSRTVTVARRAPIDVVLQEPPAGPNPARYGLWVWLGGSSSPFSLDVGTSTLGCTVNPTPLQPFAAPQPFRCLRGGLPPVFCSGIVELAAPTAAPWSATRAQGFGRIRLTLQGVIEDDGSASADRFSVTNAVIVDVP
jgi:Tol biopolymer transport system component